MTAPAEPMTAADAAVWAAVECHARRCKDLPLATRVVLGELAYRFRVGEPVEGVGALADALGLSNDSLSRALDSGVLVRLVSVRSGGRRATRFLPRTLDAAAWLSECQANPQQPQEAVDTAKSGNNRKERLPRAESRVRGNSSSSSSASSPSTVDDPPSSPGSPDWTPLAGLALRRQLAAAVAELEKGPRLKRVPVPDDDQPQLERLLAGGLPLASVERAKSAAIRHSAPSFAYVLRCLQEDFDLRRSWCRTPEGWAAAFEVEPSPVPDAVPADLSPEQGVTSAPIRLADYRAAP